MTHALRGNPGVIALPSQIIDKSSDGSPTILSSHRVFPKVEGQEWGSMIGDITMGDTEFFSDLWRSPADPNWGKVHELQ
eukprot:Skav211419  [mRNA]  locus=scaffold1608:190231:193294:+ [translate_table: standard]